jgi:mevalonate kinase
VKIRVPGKALLSGEYAVLDGGTAVLAPVPRHLTVSRGRPADDSPVVRAARDLPIPGMAPDSGLPITVDRAEFLHTLPDGSTTKLGIGGSAAEAVGVITLRHPEADAYRIFRLAFLAHNKAQDGMGSGADVAACAFGRWIRYSLTPPEPTIDVLDRPDFPMALVFSGQSADTRFALSRFAAWRQAKGDRAEEVVHRLVSQSAIIAGQWTAGPLKELIASLSDYVSLLDTVAHEAGFPYRTSPIRKLETWAEAHGGYAKPTGAGGGDMVLLLGDLPLDHLPHSPL